jgi:two-component system sensor histidine kinase ChvG
MAEDSPRRNGVRVRLIADGADRASFKGSVRQRRYVVLGHDSRMAQVMTNLIDNARSFSEPGGEVRVAVHRVLPHSEDAANDESERIIVTVEDDGPGIPPHALDRIFERFYTDRPEQGFGQNSGLGLSISRQIVEAHGGRIWAENRIAPASAVAPKAGVFVDDAYAEAAREDRDDEPLRHSAGARFVISLPAAAS